MRSAQHTYVLVTGASAGIGKALAVAFAQRSYNLLLAALPGSGLEETAASIREKFQVRVHCICLDLSDDDAAPRIHNWCRENNYNVQVLVNNAGFGNFEMFAETRMPLLNTMMKLNNNALVKLTHCFIPDLSRFNQSYILNVSSLAAFMPLPQKSVYTATKSFVYSFSDSLRYELAQQCIHVACVCPGGTLTERVKNAMTVEQKKKQDFFQTPEAVAEYAVAKMFAKKFRIIPGWKNRCLYTLSQLLPECIKMLLIRVCFKPKATPSIKQRRPSPIGTVRTFAMLRLI
jgi:uncharacterized protein